jgi:hypothetical protein
LAVGQAPRPAAGLSRRVTLRPSPAIRRVTLRPSPAIRRVALRAGPEIRRVTDARVHVIGG